MSVLGIASSPGIAQNAEGVFASVEEARRYLRENPAGPLAISAFRFIVNADIEAEYPEFPRSAIVQGYARTVPGGSSASQAEIEHALDSIAGTRSAAGAPVAAQAPSPQPPSGPATPGIGFGY